MICNFSYSFFFLHFDPLQKNVSWPGIEPNPLQWQGLILTSGSQWLKVN